jgi:hypothetical protein
VLIVGAGLSGLIAARALRAAGWAVTVIESAVRAGGRLRTERTAGAVFDTGAQFFSVRDPAFAALVDGWRSAGLVDAWCSGFAAVDAHAAMHAPVAVEDGFPRYRVVGGMDQLAEHLTRGLTVRLATQVGAIDAAEGLVTAQVQHGTASERIQADAVILTAPVPQSVALLSAGHQARPLPQDVAVLLAGVRYAPCVCVSLDYPDADEMALPPPGAVRLLDGPISWLASQRAKGLRQRGEGVVVHAHAAWSEQHGGWSDAQVAAILATHAGRLLSRWSMRDWSAPTAVTVTRWTTSLATATVAPACVQVDLGAPVLFAGDAFGDRPRVEGAALSGLAAAAALSAGLPGHAPQH